MIAAMLVFRPAGAILFKAVSHLIGRKPCLVLALCLLAVAEFAVSLVTYSVHFLLLCAAFGIVLGGVWSLSGSLIEPTQNSRLALATRTQLVLPLGLLLAAITALGFGFSFGSLNWRIPFLFAFVLALASAAFVAISVRPSDTGGPADESGSAPPRFASASPGSLPLPRAAITAVIEWARYAILVTLPLLAGQMGWSGPAFWIAIAISMLAAIGGGRLARGLSNRFAPRAMTLLAIFGALLSLAASPIFDHSIVLFMLDIALTQFFLQAACVAATSDARGHTPDGGRLSLPRTDNQIGAGVAGFAIYGEFLLALRAGIFSATEVATGIALLLALVLTILGRGQKSNEPS
jgi:predicted MFS family arabinose efflux permease